MNENEKKKELDAMRPPPGVGGGSGSVPLHATVDWAFWKKLPEVKVFEAIALLHGSEPASQPPDPDDASPEYRKTLRLLLASMSDGSAFTPCTLNIGDAALNGVRLLEVGKWAMANGYMLPDKFPRPVQVPKAPAPITPLRGNGYSPSRRPSSANWNKWKFIPKAQLWETVCLTLDVEPDEEVLGMRHWLQSRRGVPRGLPPEFADRLHIAQANMSTNGPIRPLALYSGVLQSPHAEVSLSEVAAFAVHCGWTLPEPMKALAPTIPSLATTEDARAQFFKTADAQDAVTPRQELGSVSAESAKETVERAGNANPPSSSPKFSSPKEVLIRAHEHHWPTIRGDLHDASKNGLAAAKAASRGWIEEEALKWAKAKGKLTDVESAPSDLGQAMRNLSSLPSKKHTL
ncbi:hypothetical protein ACFJI0_17060 [Hydrogenophaga sp. UC242_53]|uniref:hypothetical protein n=1 Tax=Hydrogenophaga sp. UC242_53 TaxID=3350170 RepID=UPI0036D43B86